MRIVDVNPRVVWPDLISVIREGPKEDLAVCSGPTDCDLLAPSVFHAIIRLRWSI